MSSDLTAALCFDPKWLEPKWLRMSAAKVVMEAQIGQETLDCSVVSCFLMSAEEVVMEAQIGQETSDCSVVCGVVSCLLPRKYQEIIKKMQE